MLIEYFTLPVFAGLIANILFLLLLILGQTVVFKHSKRPELAARYSLLIVLSLLFYLICIALMILMNIINHEFLHVVILAVFLVSPFVIGHFCSYPKIKKFTWIQIAVLFLSLLYLMWLSPLAFIVTSI